MERPHIIEEGFTPKTREYSVEHGFIDILGKDGDGNLMILELKARKAGVSAVKQIRRYLQDLENTDNDYLKECTPVYEEFEGNFGDISNCKTYDDLPENAKIYLRRIEDIVNVPIKFIGTGADRNNMIIV